MFSDHKNFHLAMRFAAVANVLLMLSACKRDGGAASTSAPTEAQLEDKKLEEAMNKKLGLAGERLKAKLANIPTNEKQLKEHVERCKDNEKLYECVMEKQGECCTRKVGNASCALGLGTDSPSLDNDALVECSKQAGDICGC